MRVKAKDIAEMLGISPAAVSLAINGKNGISEETRRLVFKKIGELGCSYLIKNSTSDSSINSVQELGFIIYKKTGEIINDSPFFSYVLESLNAACDAHGYSLNFLYINSTSSDSEKLQQLRSKKFLALIVFAVEMQREDLSFLYDSGIPFVCFDNSFPELDVDTVSINNLQGIHIAMDYVCGMGHTQIGYLRSKVAITSFHDRYTYYRRELVTRSMPVKPEYTVFVGYSESEAHTDIQTYLNKNITMPTVFLADNDIIACNAIAAFKRNGLKIPDDVSIIGFDNRKICTLVSPMLTTINVPKDLFGQAIFDCLANKLSTNRKHAMRTEIGTNIIERASIRRIT